MDEPDCANLTDSVDGLLADKRYLIHDRDPLFTHEFLSTLKAAGVESVKLPPRSPNLNAHAERFVRSIKESCLERLILFCEGEIPGTGVGLAVCKKIVEELGGAILGGVRARSRLDILLTVAANQQQQATTTPPESVHPSAHAAAAFD